MKQHLDILRALRGIGYREPTVSFRVSRDDLIVTVEEYRPQDGDVISQTHVPIYLIEDLFRSNDRALRDILDDVLHRLLEETTRAVVQTKGRSITTETRLRGHCDHCGKTTRYEILPAMKKDG